MKRGRPSASRAKQQRIKKLRFSLQSKESSGFNEVVQVDHQKICTKASGYTHVVIMVDTFNKLAEVFPWITASARETWENLKIFWTTRPDFVYHVRVGSKQSVNLRPNRAADKEFRSGTGPLYCLSSSNGLQIWKTKPHFSPPAERLMLTINRRPTHTCDGGIKYHRAFYPWVQPVCDANRP